jgi:hypothetical protein
MTAGVRDGAVVVGVDASEAASSVQIARADHAAAGPDRRAPWP